MLLCPKCGARLEEDSRFCCECGLDLAVSPDEADGDDTTQLIGNGDDSTRLVGDGVDAARLVSDGVDTTQLVSDGVDDARFQASPSNVAPSQPKDRKAGVIIALVVVVAVLAVLVVVFAVKSCDSSNDAEEARPAETSSAQEDLGQAAGETASSSAATADSPYIYKTEDVRIEMPARYADEGCEWSQDDSTVTFAQDGDVAAEIVWGSDANKQNEAKFDSYVIGEVSHGSIGLTAFLRVYRWDDQRQAIYAGSAADGQSSLDALDISLDELVSWVSLYTVRGFVPAAIQSDAQADGGSRAAGVSSQASSAEPFWGVWIGASKDQGEAASLASAAQGKGLPAEVTQTAEWENLNEEPWYVVTVGRSSSQDAAESLLATAKDAGYADAYVKYSGEHRG